MLIIATGGLSNLFVNDISKKIIVNKDLTLRGLFMAYDEDKN